MAKWIAKFVSRFSKPKDKTASRGQEQGKKPSRTRRLRWLRKSHHAKNEVDVDIGGSLGNKNGIENGDSSAAVQHDPQQTQAQPERQNGIQEPQEQPPQTPPKERLPQQTQAQSERQHDIQEEPQEQSPQTPPKERLPQQTQAQSERQNDIQEEPQEQSPQTPPKERFPQAQSERQNGIQEEPQEQSPQTPPKERLPQQTQAQSERQNGIQEEPQEQSPQTPPKERLERVSSVERRYQQEIENNYVRKDRFEKLDHLYKQNKEMLFSLQEDALSRVDRYQPVPDAQIQKEFDILKLAVVGFSKGLVSKAGPDVLRESLSGLALSSDMDEEVWGLNKRWNAKLLVESVIWRGLYQSLFENPFRVYGSSNDYMAAWKELFESGPDGDLYPHPSETSEQWRVITVKALDALRLDATTETRRGLEQRLMSIGYQPEQHEEDINYIITSAQKLAKTLSTQKARLRLFVPEVGERFSAKKVYNCKLEPANKHGEDLESGEVSFVVVPGLRKWGDGDGRSLETFNDQIAAKVLINE